MQQQTGWRRHSDGREENGRKLLWIQRNTFNSNIVMKEMQLQTVSSLRNVIVKACIFRSGKVYAR